eukprot:g37.t1
MMPRLQAEARPEEDVLSAVEKRWQDEVDSIRRQAMSHSKAQRLRGPSITEERESRKRYAVCVAAFSVVRPKVFDGREKVIFEACNMQRFEAVMRRATHRRLVQLRPRAAQAATATQVPITLPSGPSLEVTSPPARSNWEEWMVNLRGEDAWLASPRDLSWFTGKAPVSGLCPGVSSDGTIHALPMPNLDKVTRKQAQDYFDNSWTMVECLFAGFKGEEPFYRPPVHGLRHPQIFYYGLSGRTLGAPVTHPSFWIPKGNPPTMSETVVPCLQNDAHKIGAVVAIFTALSSSSLAHLLHHIGTDVPEEYSLRGCRGRIIQDISCGGIYLPEPLGCLSLIMNPFLS